MIMYYYCTSKNILVTLQQKVNQCAVNFLVIVIDFGCVFTYNQHMSKNTTNNKGGNMIGSRIAAVILLAGLLGACANRMVKLPTETVSDKEVPAWYLEHADTGSQGWLWNKEGMYYAVGSDVSPDMEMSHKKALIKAKIKIVDRVVGEVNNKTTYKLDETGNAERTIGRVEAQDLIVNIIADTSLRTYAVEKKLTVFNPEINNYRSFVLVKITKADVDAILKKYEQDKQNKLFSGLNKSSDLEKSSDKLLNKNR